MFLTLCFYAALCVASAAGGESAQLRFATVVTFGGCQYSVYFHSNSSVQQAYVAATVCIQQDMRTLLDSVCPQFDPLLYKNYIKIKVPLPNLSPLVETLKPALQGRNVTILRPLSFHADEPLQAPVSMERNETGGAEVTLRLLCDRSDLGCSKVFEPQQVREDFLTVETIQLVGTFEVPQAGRVKLRSRVAISGQERIISPIEDPNVDPPPRCSGFSQFKTVYIDENCTASVLETSTKGHYAIEPLMCFYGDFTSEIELNGGFLRLKLLMTSDRVMESVRRELLSKSPLSVTFMQLVSADLQVSKLLTRWQFDPLRLSADGGSAELRVRCHESCNELLYVIKSASSELWKFLRLSLRCMSASLCAFDSERNIVSLKAPEKCAEEWSPHLSRYHKIFGSLCIKSEFVRELPQSSDEKCAIKCSETPNCQAFRTNDDPCTLFVFDRCSRKLMKSDCIREGYVFVKKIPGFAPGSLCPAGYGHMAKGIKYKVFDEPGNWTAARQRCESEKGLVTMADVDSIFELAHVMMISRRQRAGKARQGRWFGGQQTPGSEEPAGGWRWVSCNTPVDRSLWHAEEPNNRNQNNENAVEVGSVHPLSWLLNDVSEHASLPDFVCKCVSPFEI